MPELPQSVGLSFREIMSGVVTATTTPGETVNAVPFSFDLQIQITSLREFVSADSHLARIDTGYVTWSGVAEHAAVLPGGTLHLFRADPLGPNRKYFDFVFSFMSDDGGVIRNLRVCDGSVFPMSAGVNPQWTIMALADHCARRM